LYTKGEWKVEVYDSHTNIEAPSQTICTNVSNCDASLIAAAPDMYEACLYARTYVPNSQLIEKALSKADGGK